MKINMNTWRKKSTPLIGQNDLNCIIDIPESVESKTRRYIDFESIRYKNFALSFTGIVSYLYKYNSKITLI
jgi:hypothetical protein